MDSKIPAITSAAGLSVAAQAYLSAEPLPPLRWPAQANKVACRRLVAARDGAIARERGRLLERLAATVEAVPGGSCPIQRATPADDRLLSRAQAARHSRRFEAAAMALRTSRATYVPDYRRPPDRTFPAAVEDGVAAIGCCFLIDDRAGNVASVLRLAAVSKRCDQGRSNQPLPARPFSAVTISGLASRPCRQATRLHARATQRAGGGCSRRRGGLEARSCPPAA